MAETYQSGAGVRRPPPTPQLLHRGSEARGGSRRTRAKAPWWFMLPALAFYAFVVLVPSVRGAGYAFTDWTGLGSSMHVTGLDNFRRLIHDSAALDALRQTVLIALAITVVQNLIGLLLALGVHSRIKSRNLLRVLLFTPAVMTPVVTAYLWRYMYAPDGAINSALSAVGLGALRQDWLGNPDLALWAVAVIVIWQFSGYSMVIFLAGLLSVPRELHEAADVDGAGPVKRFWYITRPLLTPAITINLMLSLIGGFKLFDQVYVTTGGGPGGTTETLTTLIYKNAFQYGEYGYSTAIALILTVIVAVVSAVQYRGLQSGKVSS
jgi:raffinose/stachyose/melibiose transport system permease protein